MLNLIVLVVIGLNVVSGIILYTHALAAGVIFCLGFIEPSGDIEEANTWWTSYITIALYVATGTLFWTIATFLYLYRFPEGHF